jgi:hypothetical protein
VSNALGLDDVEITEQIEASLHEGALIVNGSGEVLWCSDAACRLLRLTRDQLVGRQSLGPSFGAVHLDGSPVASHEQPGPRAIATGAPVENSVMGIQDGDDTLAWLQVTSRPVDVQGQTVAITVFSDITGRINQRRELDAAMAEIRRTLVQPGLPESGRVYFTARHRSVGPTRLMGGDCHGAHRLGPDRYAFFIGDVCGHGVEASGLSVLARHTLRTAGALLNDPSDVLRHLHDIIDVERPDTYMTALFGYIDVGETFTVRFASGGHPLPLLISDGDASAVGSTGPILGMVPNRDRPVVTVNVAPGEHLLLYTDGLTSTREREVEGSELVGSLPAHLLTDVLADVALSLADEVDRSESDDDATVLAIGFH